MSYAIGIHSYGQCDRCGFRYKYLQLRKEWYGLKVCPECYETKHPQLDPHQTGADPEALYEARPDTVQETTDFVIYTNVGLGILGTSLTAYTATMSLGTVTVEIS